MQLVNVPYVKLELKIIKSEDEITDEPLMAFEAEKELNKTARISNANFARITAKYAVPAIKTQAIEGPRVVSTQPDPPANPATVKPRTWRNMFGLLGGRKTRKRR
jgi:hypothetical protein